MMNEREIFNTARHIATADERDAYLDGACAGDADLRGRVGELLGAHDLVGSFLQSPVLDSGDTARIEGNRHLPNGTEHTQIHVAEDSLDFLSPADSPAALGRIGPYEITERIGRGGMGIVLKGHDAKLNRVVAVKIMAPELAGNATARRRFKREAQAAAAVAHPHIVTIYAVDEDRLPYLVMEFVDGMSLQEKIDREGHLELKEILRIGTQIASGLAAAHAHGVIHRDIKPANILLENGVERVRITDFGLARAADDVAMTNTGDVAGTPQYMSPEQAQGQTVDSRTDLFSLGSVLYAMCAGRSPFRADTTMGALRRVCDDRQRPIREVNPDVPVWLVDIIDRLLEKDPARRHQAAGEVAELLGKHLAHLQDPSSALRPESGKRSRGRAGSGPRRMIAVAALLLVGAIVLGEVTGVTRLTEELQPVPTDQDRPVDEADVSADAGLTRSDPSASIEQQIAELIERIEQAGEDGKARIERAHLYVRQSRWQDAADDLAAADKAVYEDPGHAFLYAILLVHLQQTDLHRQHCEKMLEHFADTDDVWTANCLVKSCLLRPGVVDVDRLPTELLTEDRELVTDEPAWVLREARALVAYRTGEFEEARRLVHETMALPNYKDDPLYAPRALAILAMAAQRSGEESLARNLYEEALNRLQAIQLAPDDIRAVSWLFAEILCREAAAVLESEQPDATLAAQTRFDWPAPPPAIAPFDGAQAQAHQKTWAAHLGAPVEFTNSIGMTFRLIPPGEFTMGSSADEQRSALSTIESTLRQFLSQDQGDVVYVERLRPLVASEGPAHRVAIGRPCYLGVTEVTAAQFEQFVTATGYVTDAERSVDGGIVWGRHGPDSSREFNWQTPGRLPRGPDHPVTQVSYDDALAFCRWLSDREGIPYDLPTEAQWEYACRAGTETPWSFGDDPAAIVDFAWSETDNEPLRHEFELHGVGLKQPNAFGLFDMHGNAQEWCRDWYSASSYNASVKVDPTATTGPDNEQTRVIRGGAIYLPGDLRSAMRRCGPVSFTENTVGFRVAIVGELSGPDLSRSINGHSESPEFPGSNEWVWTTPVNLGRSVNSEHWESHPWVAGDELTLLLTSDRPGGMGRHDLWQSTRQTINDTWNAPVPLGDRVNTEYMDLSPFLSGDGLSLFLTSSRPGGRGHWDIWAHQRETRAAEWSAAVNLGARINSPWEDSIPLLTPDGRIILFQSDRPGGQGDCDLWISRRSSMTDNWSEPVPLGPVINTEHKEGHPCLTSDGRSLYFSSNRPDGFGGMDVWMSHGASPFGPWTEPVNLGAIVNSAANDYAARLSSDDDCLYFESDRSGSFGAQDIWTSTRVRKLDYVLRAQNHVHQGRLDDAADDFALALSLTDTQEPGNAERARVVKQIVESDELFRRVVDLQPQTVGLWSHRGTFLEDEGRWEEASACFRKRLELGPDGAGLWYHAAVALFAVGDLDGYRNRCEEMLSTFGDVSDAQEAWFAVWPMAIAPDSVIDKQRALRMAERAMNGLPESFYGARAYAAWLYRLDRLEESISVWETAGQRDAAEVRDCFLAMAHHRLGNTVEALKYAGHARLNAAEWSRSMPGDLRVIFERLLGEMDAVLASPPDSDRIPPAPPQTTRAAVDEEENAAPEAAPNPSTGN